MKNLFLSGFFLLILSVSNAQEVSENELPERILDNFKEEFDGVANSSWEKEDSNYSVSFDESDVKEVNLIYDENGAILEKFESIAENELPSTLIAYLNEKYPLQEIQKSWVQSDGENLIYKVQLEEIITGGGSISGTSVGVDKDSSSEELEQDSARITLNNYQYESTERFLYFDKEGFPTAPRKERKSTEVIDLNKSEQQKEEITTVISKKSKKVTK